MSRKRSIRGKGNHGSILRQPCRYYLNGTCTRTSCKSWHPPKCQFYKNETGCKAGDKYLLRITKLKNSQKNWKKSNIPKRRETMTRRLWRLRKSQMGCVSQDSDALVSQGRKSRGNPMQKVLEPIQRVRFTQSMLRQASIREKKGPSLGKRQVKNPHQRSLYAMKFEDWSHEETERQQRCARSKAWNLAFNIYKLKEKDKAPVYFPAEEWVLPAASTKEPEERECAVDSRASMHMVSKRDLNSAELDHESRSPTTVMTANGEVQTKEEATVYVQQLDKFVKVMFLQETPAVLSLWKLCDDHGYTYHWTSGQKPHLIRNGKRIDCNISNYVPFVVLGLSASSSSTARSPTSPSSSSQDCVFGVNRYTENPVPERSGTTSGELRGDPLHESKETENKNKNGELEEVQRDFSHELLDWLQEFRENLVGESTSTEPWRNPEQGSQDTSK